MALPPRRRRAAERDAGHLPSGDREEPRPGGLVLLILTGDARSGDLAAWRRGRSVLRGVDKKIAMTYPGYQVRALPNAEGAARSELRQAGRLSPPAGRRGGRRLRLGSRDRSRGGARLDPSATKPGGLRGETGLGDRHSGRTIYRRYPVDRGLRDRVEPRWQVPLRGRGEAGPAGLRRRPDGRLHHLAVAGQIRSGPAGSSGDGLIGAADPRFPLAS